MTVRSCNSWKRKRSLALELGPSGDLIGWLACNGGCVRMEMAVRFVLAVLRHIALVSGVWA